MRAFLLILVLASCVSTNAAVLDNSVKLVRTCSEGVTVYTAPDRVGKPYQEIALLNSKGESGLTTEGGMVNSQRQKAAQLGANGIIVGGIDEPKAGTKIIGAFSWGPGPSGRVRRWRSGSLRTPRNPPGCARGGDSGDGTSRADSVNGRTGTVSPRFLRESVAMHQRIASPTFGSLLSRCFACHCTVERTAPSPDRVRPSKSGAW